MNSFENLGLSKKILENIQKIGYEEPSPIQEKIIPVLLSEDTDVIGQAQTGTGKTASFGLPIIQKLEQKKEKSKNINALILTPTRELTVQVAKELNDFKGNMDINVSAIYGGQSYTTEKANIKLGIDVLVGTPGRVIDHMNNGLIDFSKIEYFVLDEADEMLNMGFLDDIKSILANCPDSKTTLFFSATMPKSIMNVAKDFMKDYKIISAKPQQATTDLIKQYCYIVPQKSKLQLLCRVVDMEPDFYGLCFCKTKADVDELYKTLSDKGYQVGAIHGDIAQKQREIILSKFRKGHTKILIATDVAARGIDIKNLSHVVNFSMPQNPQDYTHRIGRTGRAGKSGTAITFVTPSEKYKLRNLEKNAKVKIEKKDIPTIEEVMKNKENIFKSQINDIIENNQHKDYQQLANELLKNYDAESVVSALLSKDLGKEFNKIDKKDIDTTSTRANNERPTQRGSNDSVRLFVGGGKKDGMTKKDMVEYISKNTGIDQKHINDMYMMDEFSFFNSPEKYANQLIKKSKEKLKFNIEKARQKKQ